MNALDMENLSLRQDINECLVNGELVLMQDMDDCLVR